MTMDTTSIVRPRVSVVLLAYNQAHMVRRAVQSVLAQACEPLEVVLSDDASTDDTYAQLQAEAAAYRGPHQVSVRRNEANVGIGEHYNRLLAATSGELIVTAAGDDVSEPGRIARLIEAWDATGQRADLIASHVIDLDHEGVTHEVIKVDDLSVYRGIDDWLRRRPYIIGAGHAFTRRMMERFGPMNHGVFYEDQIMVFRAIVSGGAITVDAPLVQYRRGGTSRLPDFESIEHMRSWNERQNGRMLAEMQQLLSDARVVAREPAVRALLENPLKRSVYLSKLRWATSREQRWAAFHEAAPLPLWWRLRKLLHVSFPRLTLTVKRGLSVLHSRQH